VIVFSFATRNSTEFAIKEEKLAYSDQARATKELFIMKARKFEKILDFRAFPLSCFRDCF
jgi:hypothetical protein